MAPLKWCGSRSGVLFGFRVSMTERSWLHWSSNGFSSLSVNGPGFHDWKVMAPLKCSVAIWRPLVKVVSMTERSWLHWSTRVSSNVLPFCQVSMTERSWLHWSRFVLLQSCECEPCFHDWKVMAPLKLIRDFRQGDCQPGFPWLKGHGSIEVWDIGWWQYRNHRSFHDWKVMAPLKWESVLFGDPVNRTFPWPESYGISESKYMGYKPDYDRKVSMTERSWLHWSMYAMAEPVIDNGISMTERSWLHWSVVCAGGTYAVYPSFHDRKVMAPLKRPHDNPDVFNGRMFPWPKGRGSIKFTAAFFTAFMIAYGTVSSLKWRAIEGISNEVFSALPPHCSYRSRCEYYWKVLFSPSGSASARA